ncbi:hypothetical protein [Neobacillus sp. PS3-40]|uniref:hypothetical protein n=1 Tax=Neobacillus sp. PS3-40 TaxID=3070679 RepID=UPI0027DF8777|nr:hypothetical protein [Neobacillus sp. PS3-40]WML44795.1 hypothetical protein RCG20_02505 [Neobacillus sp. PS3-40]
MDKISCLAFILYQSSKSQEIKEKAIQLLNGDITLRELKRNCTIQPHLVIAEGLLKKNKIDKNQVQEFIEEFMLIEA